MRFLTSQWGGWSAFWSTAAATALSPHSSPCMSPHLTPHLSACVIGVLFAAAALFPHASPLLWVGCELRNWFFVSGAFVLRVSWYLGCMRLRNWKHERPCHSMFSLIGATWLFFFSVHLIWECVRRTSNCWRLFLLISQFCKQYKTPWLQRELVWPLLATKMKKVLWQKLVQPQ